MRESRYWILFLASGVLMIVLLGIHLFLMHFAAMTGASDPLQYSAVLARSNSLTWKVTYMVLLVLALYHSLYGLRSMRAGSCQSPGRRACSYLAHCLHRGGGALSMAATPLSLCWTYGLS